MVGMLAKAFLNDASVIPASALKPARISSLFLTPTPSVNARFFISPICSSSVLGMVKLSRTTLTFLSFKGFAGADACFLSVGLEAGLAAGSATGLTALATVALTVGFVVAFFATGWARCVLADAAFNGAAAFLRAGAWVLLDLDVGVASTAGVDGVEVREVMFMASEFLKLTVYTVYTVDSKMTSQQVGDVVTVPRRG